MARADLSFPHPLYDKFVLQPFFADAQVYYFAPMLAANRAHAVMLSTCGIISRDNAAALLNALAHVEAQGVAGLRYRAGVEDLFFAMENEIIALAGAAHGGNLQLARSRNDLGYALTRLALRTLLLEALDDLLSLRESLREFACMHLRTLMPGYTHTQPAQPTTFAHYIAGVLAGLARDTARLQFAWATNNQSPLGAAALTGTAFPIDRALSARLLGFDSVMHSTYDSIGASDNLTDVAGALSSLAVNLSRFTKDMLFWATQESGAVNIHNSFLQISSIMPQKRNPVVLEHLRARISRMLAQAQGIVLQCHNIPFGDTQDIEDEIFPLLFGSLETGKAILQLYAAVVDTMEINVQRLRARAGAGFTTVTELADTLVRECGLPFRQAHNVVAALVGHAQAERLSPADLTAEILQRVAADQLGLEISLADAAFQRALDAQAFVDSRSLHGGAAPAATADVLAAQHAQIQVDRRWLDARHNALRAADEWLNNEIAALLTPA
ncbi:MAG: argininosuccinate lyase [Chloroflexi bacterium]|nr:argininosuccinate lyase [Chloroflexota bacterium]MCY4246171.1 argininosuccinate lyase [Chloroflexota bacterium]